MCPKDHSFVEVEEKIFGDQDVIHPYFSHSALEKI
jgi:hypothetical protein